MRGVWAGLVALGVPGCSVVVSAEVRPPRCEQSAECEVLNQIDGIASDAPARWRCAAMERICLLLPRDEDGDGESPIALGGTDCDDRPGVGARRGARQAEVADGVDNDCDGVIDEGAWVSASRELGATQQAPRTHASATSSDRASAAFITAMGVGTRAGVVDGALTTSRLGYKSVFTRAEAAVVEAGCPRGVPDAPRAVGCDFADLAAAEVARPLWIAAAVSTHECASGQLYLAAFDEADHALTLDFRTRGRASNLAPGVDVASSGPPCSGASATGAPLGASRPSVAALREGEGQPARALLAWHGRSVADGDERCGQSAQVYALGAWITQESDGATRFAAAQAVRGARPAALGTTRASARPAVLPLPDARGFVVAHGRDGGGLALRVVPTFVAAASTELDLSRPPLVLASDAPNVDRVVVSAGSTRGGRQELGVAWREGCGAQAPLRFARVRLDPASPGSSEVSAAQRLSERASAAFAMAYADQGILQVGATYAGAAVGAEDDGGWVVAWSEPDATGLRVIASRLSERTARPIELGADPCAEGGVEAPSTLGTFALGATQLSLHRVAEDGVGVLRALVTSGARWHASELLFRRGGASVPERSCR